MTSVPDRTASKTDNSAIRCPCCGQPMVPGRLYGPSGQGVYWLPDSTEPSGIKGSWCLQTKHIEAAGGIVLDEVSPAGFLATNRPCSFYCNACGIFLTKRRP